MLKPAARNTSAILAITERLNDRIFSMILSYRHKFIFVKGRKVAGTSIEMALSPHCGPQDIVTPISPVDELKRLSLGGQPQNYSQKDGIEAHYIGLVQEKNNAEAIKTRVHSDKVYPFFNHMSLAAIEALVALPSHEYYLIYAVRNPYAKVSSLANMNLSLAKYTGKPMENSVEDIRNSIGQLFTSGQYILARNHVLYQGNRPYKAQIILRQEHLSADLHKLLNTLGINKEPALIPHAKQGSIAKKYSVDDLFTRAQLDTINETFADEFLAHGYPMI